MVIGAEKLSSIVNWEDRNTCVLFGDGSGAAVFAMADEEARAEELLRKAGEETGFPGILCPSRPAGFELVLQRWGVAKR